jgi:hypothetical protein
MADEIEERKGGRAQPSCAAGISQEGLTEDEDLPDYRDRHHFATEITAKGCGPNRQPPPTKRVGGLISARTEMERLAAYIAAMVKNGSLGRGSAALKKSYIHPPSQAVREAVAALFPQDRVQLPGIDADAPRVEVTPQTVRKAVAALSKGAAPGMSGTTDKHIRAIIATPGGLEALTKMITMIANCECPLEFYRILHTTKATPLAKDHDRKDVNKNVRPVGPPETMKKLVQKVLMLSKADNGATMEQLLKHELRRGNSFALHGPEEKLRQLNKTYTEFTKKRGAKPIVMKIDMSNGYGEIKVAQVLQRLYQSHRTKRLARFIHAVAGVPVAILMRTENKLYEQLIVNEQSLMQGDVLSPILYSLAMMVING